MVKNNLTEVLNQLNLPESVELDYLILPATTTDRRPMIIDWDSVKSALFSSGEFLNGHINCHFAAGSSCWIHTKNGMVCSCMLRNSVVYTPHNGYCYCTTGMLNGLSANSPLKTRNGKVRTYKNYFEEEYVVF